MRNFDLELFVQCIGLALFAGLFSYGLGFLAVMSYGFGGFDLLTCLMGVNAVAFGFFAAVLVFMAFE